jgi:hypothetical protein
MFSMRNTCLHLIRAVGTVALLACTGQAGEPQKVKEREFRVKTTTEFVSGADRQEGVVAKIDEDEVVLVEIGPAADVKEHKCKPIDHLRAGKVLFDAAPRFAYRWGDMKVGDTVELEVAEDHLDKQLYCLAIRIHRRPKGKLPASQKQDADKAFPWLRVYNDLENGEDVDDDEINKAFPKREEVRDKVTNRLLISASPGGLPKEWQVKLDAIRAKKKDGGVKAAPPDKK